jgi:hypothetical protein
MWVIAPSGLSYEETLKVSPKNYKVLVKRLGLADIFAWEHHII